MKNDFWALTRVDNIRLEMVGGSDLVFSEEDNDRGFYLFGRSVMESHAFEKRIPTPSERIERLLIHMGRGEYEPGFVGLYALRGLDDVDLRLTGELTDPSGATIDAAAVTVRRAQGVLLPLTRPRGVDRGGMLAWWVTAKTAPTTAAVDA